MTFSSSYLPHHSSKFRDVKIALFTSFPTHIWTWYFGLKRKSYDHSYQTVFRPPKHTTLVRQADAKQVIWYVSWQAPRCLSIVLILSSIAKPQAMQHPWTINLLLPGSTTFCKGARMSNSCLHLIIPSTNSSCFLRQPTTWHSWFVYCS